MTPYQIICGLPFKRIVDLDFWHLWRFFIATKVSGSLYWQMKSVCPCRLLVFKKFRGWQNPSKKVKVRLFSDFFLENKTLPAFPFCSNWSLSLFNFHDNPKFHHKINKKDLLKGLQDYAGEGYCVPRGLAQQLKEILRRRRWSETSWRGRSTLSFWTRWERKINTRRQFHAHTGRLHKQIVCYKLQVILH